MKDVSKLIQYNNKHLYLRLWRQALIGGLVPDAYL